MLSVILPTFNEAKNIATIVGRVQNAMEGVDYEIIIVDDNSPDHTWKVAQELAHGRDNLHIVRRIDKRGLSSAVIDGFLAAKGNVLLVMDADGQHDTSLLLQLGRAVEEGAGIAIGSRYIEGGSVGQWDERRYALSQLATRLAINLCKVKVADPMSGYFAISRTVFERALPKLNPKGFKILLDFLVHVPKNTVVREIPLQFGERMAGESKLSRKVQIEFLEYLYDVTFGKWIPLVFVKYCIVGLFGVVVNLAAYMLIASFFREHASLPVFGFSVAVVGATQIAIVFNFLLNNVWTFSLSRLRGIRMLTGFLKFEVACAFGAIANFAVSSYLFSIGWAELLCVIIGSMVGVVWNYTMNRLLTWRTV